MNEKEVIEGIKRLIKWFEKWDDDYTLVPCDKVYAETVLNLIEKQQAEIEKYKTLLSEANVQFLNSNLETKRKNEEDLEMLYAGCQEELEKKDRIIYEIAKAFKQDDIRSVEEIVEYFNQKIEKGE